MVYQKKFICVLLLIVAIQSTEASILNPMDLINDFLDKTVSFLIQQKPGNTNGPEERFRALLMNDDTNDELKKATPQEIIFGAGYQFKNHHVTSDDGYVTQLIRIINPLVNRTFLKQPPIMLIHGGLIDCTSFIWGSILEHHPEIYPRVDGLNPMTSANRSLAFMLANNGYDVWLVGTRGSNQQNRRHLQYKLDKIPESKQLLALDGESQKYFKYSMDEISELEVPRQMDKVMQVTGAKNVSVVALSLGTQIFMALLASNPEYAAKTHSYIGLGSILNQKGSNLGLRLIQETICLSLPDELGTSLFTQLVTSYLAQKLLPTLLKSPTLRYSLGWIFINVLAGSSPTFQSWYELPVLGHFGQTLGFVETKHYCQQAVAGKLHKFDYGVAKNLEKYGSLSPPVHELSKIRIKNWALVSAGLDNLATPSSSIEIIRESGVKPKKHIHVPHFNHFDLIGSVENDIYANLPMLEFLDRFHFTLTQAPETNLVAE